MRDTNKRTIKSLMAAAQAAHKSASDEVKRINSDKDLTDTARYFRSEAVADRFRNTITGIRGKLKEEKELTEKEITAARKFNSQRRLSNSDYQNRLLLEADFIRGLPDSIEQEDIKERLSVFYGDDLARQYLSAVINEISAKRKERGLLGLNASELLPDLYGVQLEAVKKLFSAIDGKLSSVSDGFIAQQAWQIGAEKNESAALFMDGLFSGISDYMDTLPDKIAFPGEVRLSGVDYADIPAYASGPDDLEINYSMFRKS